MLKIKHFFKVFFKVIDKLIILPISKASVKLIDFLKSKLKNFEKSFTKKSTLIILSLVFSLIVFFFIDTKSISIAETTAEVIYGQKVKAIFNEEAYVIEGIPSTVDITLIGRKSDLYLAKQLPTHDVSLDLKELKPGTHKVSLKYKGSIDSINYKLDPSIVSVVIYTKISEVRTIDVDVVNQDKLNSRLVVSDIKIDRDKVIIKDAEHKLKDVASIKALVDINNLSKPDVGTVELTDIPLIAYDNKGNIVETETVPSKVTATITISSPSKVVPVVLIPKGTLAFGKGISSISSDVSEVTIYGEQSTLDSISSIPISVNVDKIDSDRKVTVTIDKPTGVRFINKNSAVVNILLGNETSKEIQGIKISIVNLSDKYKAFAVSKEDSEVDVIVKGVEKVIDDIEIESIKAIVDLAGYGIGEHEIPLKIEGADLKLLYVPKVKTVTISISNK